MASRAGTQAADEARADAVRTPFRPPSVPRRAVTASRTAPSEILLELQQRAGNRAVSAALLTEPAVQRFVGREHKELGDSTGATMDLGNGVVLSWGDIVALAGDEYASPDELLADTRTEAGKQRLLAAFRHDAIPDPPQSRLSEPTADQNTERAATYLRLASENVSHFNAGGQALERWTVGHTAALTAALDAGLADDASAMQVAMVREAFAQHFLTDSFSGGHVRTPRQDIIGWYRANFGASVIDELLRRLTARLIDGLVAQISPQTSWPDALVRWKVEKVVGKKLAAAIAQIGGRAVLIDDIALGVAGVVSGAMHDLEGRRGVAVSSEAHPEPWIAFGDAQLADSPVSRTQAELAVAAGAGQVRLAHDIGRTHRRAGGAASAPTVSYFPFDSAELSPAAGAQVAAAGRYLDSHPDITVTVTGHTDPTGPDAYNDHLGWRRANAVAARLAAAGARTDQVEVRSAGEQAPVALEPGRFPLNRRVTFDYVSRPGPFRDPARDAALGDLAAKVAPPYADVVRYVPRPLPAPASSQGPGESTTAASQVALENWRWGGIPPTLRGAIDTWVRGYGPLLSARVSEAGALSDVTVEGYTVRPRPLVEEIVRDLLRDPSGFLENAFGRPMSP